MSYYFIQKKRTYQGDTYFYFFEWKKYVNIFMCFLTVLQVTDRSGCCILQIIINIEYSRLLFPVLVFRSVSRVHWSQTNYILGPVVQTWISANPGLKFHPVFYFVYFCTLVYFKTSKKKTFVGPDKISEKISPSL